MPKKYVLGFLFLSVLIGFIGQSGWAKPEVDRTGRCLSRRDTGNAHIHQPEEILEIMKKSKLVYHMESLKGHVSPIYSTEVLEDQLYIENTKKGGEFKRYILSKKAKEVMEAAEVNFRRGKYADAIRQYLIVKDLEPKYGHIDTLIGDAYFKQEDYKNAENYFRQAIETNYINYQAHWFLADTLWHRGEKEAAVDEMTLAHILNINHPIIKDGLKHYRERVNRPWKEWVFDPKYILSEEKDGVRIKANAAWRGYAMVKAIWKYEPGYAEKALGEKYEPLLFCSLEETEALGMFAIIGGGLNELVGDIILDRFINELMYYEIAARRDPHALPGLTKKEIKRVAYYVDKYH